MKTHTLSMLGGLTLAMVMAACSGGDVTDAAPAPAPNADAGVVAVADAGTDAGDIPATPDALQTWLGKRLYRAWAHESAKHASTGPHGGEVQTYLNEKLVTSMQGTTDHPEGAVAVKELYGSGSEVTGWAVMIKTQASSANGQGFYWYESFDTKPGARRIEGQGEKLCVDCHAAGKDHVLVPFPLR